MGLGILQPFASVRGARSLAFVAALLMAGCEGVGIPATDDPNAKLSQAEYLRTDAGRIMQARRLTEQAIELFAQRGDKLGLAEAYRELGLVALDGGLGDDPVVRRDPKAPLQPRPGDLDNADKYLKRALDFASEFDQPYMAGNINFVLGNIEVMRGTPLQSCAYYDLSIRSFRDAQTRMPDLHPIPPVDGSDPATFAGRAKKAAGCP